MKPVDQRLVKSIENLLIRATEEPLVIECREGEAVAHDPSGRAILRATRDVIVGAFGAKPCLTPGVCSPTSPPSIRYLNALVSLTKLISCLYPPELYVFVDDASAEHVEELKTLYLLLKKHGISVEKMLALDFKKLVASVKEMIRVREEIERVKTKGSLSEDEYSTYSSLTLRLDRLLSSILKALNGNVDAVVKLYEAVKEVQRGFSHNEGVYEEIRLLNEALINGFVERINGFFEKAGVEPTIVKLSSLHPRFGGFGFKEALLAVHDFLGKKRCSSKIIIGSEEAAVAAHVLNLDFITIGLS